MARLRAPELVGAGGWVGTTQPLSLAMLAGKIVVLDFWSACGINCLRLIDELRPIEQRFVDEAVFIGIHSPKFPREHEHDSVVDAVARYHIAHPVLDDPDLVTWQQYGVRGWPTVVVVDPEGYVVGGVSGEGCGPVVTNAILGLIATHEANDTLVRGRPSALIPPLASPPAFRVLSYPGKVAADASGSRIAISDSANNRVVVSDLRGRVERIIDGLRFPQGLRFGNGELIICDTGADRIITVSLEGDAQRVLASGIASPWDVVIASDGSYLVAEAGRHRLWRVLDDGTALVAAGTGEENLVDGAAPEALLAQPSGLARVDRHTATVFVDAESSALRVLTDGGRIVTLVGRGLFDWGASDGGPSSAALQHPLGLAATSDGTVYIADTFNSLLRVWVGTGMTASAGELRTLPVEGLEEPGGVDLLSDGRLIVADTNHHRVVFVDPDAGTVVPLILDESWQGTIGGDAMTASEGDVIRIPYALDLGAMQLDDSGGPPVRIDVTAVPPTLLAPGPRRWELNEQESEIELTAGRAGSGMLLTDTAASVCDDTHSIVLMAKTRHDLTVEPAPAPLPLGGSTTAAGLSGATSETELLGP